MNPQDLEMTIKFNNAENRVYVSQGTGNEWMDLGLLLEAVGVLMAFNLQKENPKSIKTKDEMVAYVKQYIEKVGNDYHESFKGIVSPFI